MRVRTDDLDLGVDDAESDMRVSVDDLDLGVDDAESDMRVSVDDLDLMGVGNLGLGVTDPDTSGVRLCADEGTERATK